MCVRVCVCLCVLMVRQLAQTTGQKVSLKPRAASSYSRQSSCSEQTQSKNQRAVPQVPPPRSPVPLGTCQFLSDGLELLRADVHVPVSIQGGEEEEAFCPQGFQC